MLTASLGARSLARCLSPRLVLAVSPSARRLARCLSPSLVLVASLGARRLACSLGAHRIVWLIASLGARRIALCSSWLLGVGGIFSRFWVAALSYLTARSTYGWSLLHARLLAGALLWLVDHLHSFQSTWSPRLCGSQSNVQCRGVATCVLGPIPRMLVPWHGDWSLSAMARSWSPLQAARRLAWRVARR